MQHILLLIIVFSLGAVSSAARAMESFQPAIMYESESEGDNAFIDSMKRGAEQAKEEVNIKYKEFRLPDGKQRKSYMRKVAQSGVTHVIAVGFQNVVPVLSLAEEFPEVKFTVIDGIVPPLFKNVQSVNFKDHEGAFLVGMVAGYTAPTNKIGFIGGMDVPLIDNFYIGFYQGVRYANPDIEMLRDNVGTDATAWSNPERAKSLAKKQYNAGAGVIFAAAGGSSVGVLEAAEEMGKLAIGVDTNQNGLYPGAVLTSMIKRVDTAVYKTLVNSFSGRWEPGIKYLGVRENALDYSVDVHNKDRITKKIIDDVEDAKDRIVRGQLKVESYKPY